MCACQDLDPEAVLTPDEAREVQQKIERATKEMRTEAAWAAASRRAGVFFGLPDEQESGVTHAYEALREFTAGVRVVGSEAPDEFFSKGGQDVDGGTGARADVDGARPSELPTDMPSAEFIRFNAAGLQTMLAEGCLFGWLLWRAENEAVDVLAGSGAESSLLTSPATPV